jgi:hypothetical protein
MKVVFTPIDTIEEFLVSEEGDKKLLELKEYQLQLEKMFQKLYDLPLKLTPEAARTYLDLRGLDTELHRFLLTSGLMPAFDWGNWLEGNEIIEGIRKSPSINRLKALKLLSLILKLDQQKKGRFEQSLYDGQILWLLDCLFSDKNLFDKKTP